MDYLARGKWIATGDYDFESFAWLQQGSLFLCELLSDGLQALTLRHSGGETKYPYGPNGSKVLQSRSKEQIKSALQAGELQEVIEEDEHKEDSESKDKSEKK